MEDPAHKHIVMVPFLAHGNLIPFLELAYKILHHNPIFTISIANTPYNINYLTSVIADHPSPPSQIHLISLPFNSSGNTHSLPLTQFSELRDASAALEALLRGFLSDIVADEGSPPICMISDMLLGWANEVARSFSTVNYSFTTSGAYGTAAYCSIYMNLPHRNLADGGTHNEFPVPGFPDSCRFFIGQLTQYVRAADGKDERTVHVQRLISQSLQSNGWLCNTVEETETTGATALRNFIKLPVWCIGPLLPSKMLKKNSDSSIISERSGKQPEKCIEWLNSHPESSVLYISFGSQNTISKTQMMELAKGLEESKQPFIWVIRPPMEFDLRDKFRSEWLPMGFEDRIKNQGLMVYNWAPQLEILCHRSTGAFLSHCGWNSVMESLSQGVPLIGWPLAAEQGYNAKMLVEEMGVCVMLKTGLQGMIEKEQVKKVIEVVFDKTAGGKGIDIRKKASEIGKLITANVEGSSYKAMDDFVSTILSG